MTLWLLARILRQAPRRAILGALGVAFPVAMLVATLLFVDRAVGSMTRIALEPVQVEQRALVTSLNVDATKLARQLATVPGVKYVDRFATADVVVRAPGVLGGSTARLFAIDKSYLRHHRWVRVVRGSLGRGALLDQSLRDFMPAFRTARRVTIEIPGGGRSSLTLPAAGTVDLRNALPTWFSIPTGDVQGDVALVPRGIVVPFAAFQRTLLPAFEAKLGPTTPVLNPGLTDLPPVSVEAHVAVDHRAYPADPGAATVWSDALRHLLERRPPAGSIVVADNAAEPLTEAASDATNAKILFLLLGIPGALAAAALGLAAQSALAEAQRREDGLLRLRGATEGQLLRLASAQAAVSGLAGFALGLLAAFGAVSVVEGNLAWRGVPGGSLAAAIAAGLAIAAVTTAARLLVLVRTSRRVEVVAERRMLERGWRPLWLRAHLDLVAIAIGLVILGINLLSGGLKPNPIAASQGSTLGLSFYVLLAPIALWIGLTLLAVRLLLVWSRRRTTPDRSDQLPSWRGAALRWLGRRPARAGVVLVLGALAVSFATEVVAFVATYGKAKQRDAAAAFGADLRIVPGDPLYTLPRLRGAVGEVTPIREVPVRAGTDRKTTMAIDLRTYSKTAKLAPTISAGGGIEALRHDRSGIVVAQEIATDLGVRPGDNLPLTVFPDDKDRSQNLNFHVVGVFRSFPPSDPYAEMVTSTAALPPYLLPRPDFYLARAPEGAPPATAEARLRALPGFRQRFAVGTLAQRAQTAPRSLTALNLNGLKWIESVGAGLIAAVGVALLAAFVVLERRREFAVLEAVGADRAQVVTGPTVEGAVALAGSVLIGLPLGLLLSMLAVRVLGLFFTLPPPLLSVPLGTLALLVVLMVCASLLALAVALRRIARVGAVTMLREP
ncbi:MAG TPA: FtsX-like permease family protein [Gaiellaceae bacterium]|nr:FtsX-like permease family protein [Gaiellaceae bacterium]